MATAKKLPSGSWRCQVFSHYEIVLDKNGKPVIDPKTKKQKQKRIYKSFTCDDPSARGKRKAEAMAAEWAEDIDPDWAKRSQENALKRLNESKSDFEHRLAELKLKRALNRIKISSMK